MRDKMDMELLSYSRMPAVKTQIDLGADHRSLPFERWLVHAGIMADGGTAGFPVLLPAGHRVMEKLRRLVRRHANRVGFHEMQFPSLYPADLLERSGRLGQFGSSVFQCPGEDRKTLLLAPTHEEWISDFFADQAPSWGRPGQLPKMVYQIAHLWRDLFSGRGKGGKGFLKVNEFELFESYTLCADEEQLDQVMDKVDDLYRAIFGELGLTNLLYFDYRRVADGESRRPKVYTDHLLPHEKGEYRFFRGESGQLFASPGRCVSCRAPLAENHGDAALRFACAEGHPSGAPGLAWGSEEPLRLERMFTVGMSMRVEDECTKPFQLHYRDRQGALRPVVMGTHGLGLLRLLLALYDRHHGERGMEWPAGLSPCDVTVVPRTEEDLEPAQAAWRCLTELGLESVIDDRFNMSHYARVLFSELLGIPRVLAVGRRGDSTCYSVIPRGARNAEVTKSSSLATALANLPGAGFENRR
ncbi:MAG: hypothetical protein HY698_19385 [Deltaproteobacteria bacterium]|nr:hypothetical protein [Deltaproteobacteria bacterium]